MALGKVRAIIPVLSGKGGVGKSSVTYQLALALTMSGSNVGILDIDLTGPSMPRLLHVEDATVRQVPGGWLPVESQPVNSADRLGSLHCMSLGFLLSHRSEAIVWRGPKKTAMIRQFLEEVIWGDLDYLLVDTPPGTGDEHIALAEALTRPDRRGSVPGAVIVTTPQAVALSDVKKEINFCQKTTLPILGIIENMSGFVCPNCSECSNLFSRGGGEAVALQFGIPFLGRVPIDPQFVAMIEEHNSLDVQSAHDASSPPSENRDRKEQCQSVDHPRLALVDKYRRCALYPQMAGIAQVIAEESSRRTTQ